MGRRTGGEGREGEGVPHPSLREVATIFIFVGGGEVGEAKYLISTEMWSVNCIACNFEVKTSRRVSIFSIFISFLFVLGEWEGGE